MSKTTTEKEAAAVYGTKANGTKVLRGHNAVSPSGSLVLLPKDTDLPDPAAGWRWATAADVAAAEKAAAALAAKDKPNPARGVGPLKK